VGLANCTPGREPHNVAASLLENLVYAMKVCMESDQCHCTVCSL